MRACRIVPRIQSSVVTSRTAPVVLAALAIAVAAGPALALAPDPGVPGPLAVSMQDYDFGDDAFLPSDLSTPVEVRARVHRPTDLSGGPFPLVLLLHGRHDTCYDGGSSFMQWPCDPAPPRQPIPSYTGYDYVAEILASHGYIVASISANGINAQDGLADGGALARAELLQRHLELWEAWDSVGGAPFGATFVGKVDLANVGTMGHSRGGEGVVRHVQLNDSLGAPYGIRAIFPLAPVNFTRPIVNDVALAVLLPYCDGDVYGNDGVYYYDDARYNLPGDTGPKHTIEVLGANHIYYNTIWTPSIFPAGSLEDWDNWGTDDTEHCGPDMPNERLTEAEQRGTGVAYLAAFFRAYLGGESEFLPLLKGDEPPPASAMTDQVYLAYHPADDPAVRRDVNRLLDESNLSTNTVGGAVSSSGVTPNDLCGAGGTQPLRCLPDEFFEGSEPHAAHFESAAGLSQLRAGWDDASASYDNELTGVARDVSPYHAVQFRASVNFDDLRNPLGADQDLSVTLVDGAGLSATVPVEPHTQPLFYPPGMPDGGPSFSPVPRLVQNSVRVPLSEFTGLFLGDIRSLRLDFDRTASGALLITDLMFADASDDAPPSVSCTVATSALWPPNANLVNVGLGVTATDDLDPGVVVELEVYSDEDDQSASGGGGGSAGSLVFVTPAGIGGFASALQPEGAMVGLKSVFSPDAKEIAEGTLRLRAERAALGDGRVYVVVATATDSAGQLARGCCTAVVPKNQSTDALTAVAAQANEALDSCTALAAHSEGLAALPAGYFVVGDGPLVGPKQ